MTGSAITIILNIIQIEAINFPGKDTYINSNFCSDGDLRRNPRGGGGNELTGIPALNKNFSSNSVVVPKKVFQYYWFSQNIKRNLHLT